MKATLNATATSFVPSKKVDVQTDLKLESQEFKFVPVKKVQEPVKTVEAPVTVPTTTGGFGNKQTSVGLTLPVVIYREILVHCVKVSIQEMQKKMKMYQKKVTKPKQKAVVCAPDLQYMNIYASSVKRLRCFESITDGYDLEEDDEALFHGDATAYEHHLDEELRKVAEGYYDDYIQGYDDESIQSQAILIQ